MSLAPPHFEFRVRARWDRLCLLVLFITSLMLYPFQSYKNFVQGYRGHASSLILHSRSKQILFVCAFYSFVISPSLIIVFKFPGGGGARNVHIWAQTPELCLKLFNTVTIILRWFSVKSRCFWIKLLISELYIFTIISLKF